MYLKRTDDVRAETMFSKCFTDGTVFYTCLIGSTVMSGFLRPEDTFAVEKVKPKLWKSFGDGFEYSNMGFNVNVEDHEEYHKKEVRRLLKKEGNFCPSRLKKFRNFTFFD